MKIHDVRTYKSSEPLPREDQLAWKLAAVATDPECRTALANAGFTMDPKTGEIEQLAPYVGAFSARTAQIRANVDRHEAEWRTEHPGADPGPSWGQG